jgi:hypothetical protein
MIIYETWLTVVATGLMFSYLYIFDPYVEFVERRLNFKPFNCVLCATFWFSIPLNLILGIDVIYAFFSPLIAELVYRKLVN